MQRARNEKNPLARGAQGDVVTAAFGGGGPVLRGTRGVLVVGTVAAFGP